jgi:hypothetical protein
MNTEFDIETYFQNLPIDIEFIDVRNKKLKYIPKSIIKFNKLV